MDGLRNELGEQLSILTVNISSQAGEVLSRQYGSRITPTFIFLDETGNEVWRSVGRLDAQQVRDSLPTR